MKGAVETYIVRIYRRNSTNTSEIFGAVEIPGQIPVIPFEGMSALENILTAPQKGDEHGSSHEQ